MDFKSKQQAIKNTLNSTYGATSSKPHMTTNYITPANATDEDFVIHALPWETEEDAKANIMYRINTIHPNDMSDTKIVTSRRSNGYPFKHWKQSNRSGGQTTLGGARAEVNGMWNLINGSVHPYAVTYTDTDSIKTLLNCYDLLCRTWTDSCTDVNSPNYRLVCYADGKKLMGTKNDFIEDIHGVILEAVIAAPKEYLLIGASEAEFKVDLKFKGHSSNTAVNNMMKGVSKCWNCAASNMVRCDCDVTCDCVVCRLRRFKKCTEPTCSGDVIDDKCTTCRKSYTQMNTLIACDPKRFMQYSQCKLNCRHIRCTCSVNKMKRKPWYDDLWLENPNLAAQYTPGFVWRCGSKGEAWYPNDEQYESILKWANVHDYDDILHRVVSDSIHTKCSKIYGLDSKIGLLVLTLNHVNIEHKVFRNDFMTYVFGYNN